MDMIYIPNVYRQPYWISLQWTCFTNKTMGVLKSLTLKPQFCHQFWHQFSSLLSSRETSAFHSKLRSEDEFRLIHFMETRRYSSVKYRFIVYNEDSRWIICAALFSLLTKMFTKKKMHPPHSRDGHNVQTSYSLKSELNLLIFICKCDLHLTLHRADASELFHKKCISKVSSLLNIQ